MKPRVLLATSNEHKIEEIKGVLGPCLEILSFKDFSLKTPKEDGSTLEENALIKAKYSYEITKVPSLGEDTGLFVDALDGKPGVYSSRFAPTDSEKRRKLLELLNGKNRKAKFITVLCFYDGNRTLFFRGILEGEISECERGNRGFGYDPIFIPKGYDKTLGEMEFYEKNKISHRARALREFLKWLVSAL